MVNASSGFGGSCPLLLLLFRIKHWGVIPIGLVLLHLIQQNAAITPPKMRSVVVCTTDFRSDAAN